MSANDRLRVLLVAALALGVMGGVVAHAISNPSQPEPDPVSSRDPGPVVRTPGSSPATPSAPHKRAMPDGCEVDPAHPPQVVFDLEGDRIDFGFVKQGVLLEKKIAVRNVGSGPLCVRDVETGCGCVTAEWLGEARIPPASSGTLRILLNTAGREGTYDKAVRLFTNDPRLTNGVAEIMIAVEIRLGIVVGTTGASSTLLLFGRHPPGQPGTATIRLKSQRTEPEWRILSIESLDVPQKRTKFTWELIPVEPNDPAWRHYDLRVTHPGRIELGLAYEPVRIKTSHPERPEIQITSSLQVEPKYYAGPSRMTFGFIRRDSVVPTKTVHVMPAEAGADFRVTGAKVLGDGFVVSEPRRSREGWEIDVRYDGKTRDAGTVRAALVISIDDPELPELRVPLEAIVTGG